MRAVPRFAPSTLLFLRTFVTVVMAHLDGPRRYLPMRICLSQIASAIGLTSIRVLHLFIRLKFITTPLLYTRSV